MTLPSVAPGVTAASATFTTSTLAQANHVLRVLYNGDNNAPFPLPTSFPFRGQWIPSNSPGFGLPVKAKGLQSPSFGSVPLGAAPKPTGMISSSTTLSTTKSGFASGLSASSVDGYFASSTTRPAARTLAGALAKVRSGDDWLTGVF